MRYNLWRLQLHTFIGRRSLIQSPRREYHAVTTPLEQLVLSSIKVFIRRIDSMALLMRFLKGNWSDFCCKLYATMPRASCTWLLHEK